MTQVKYKTPNSVDENQTRIHAVLTVLLILTYLFSGNMLVIYILIYDFLVRIYVTPLCTPLYLISESVVKISGLKRRLVDESAKEFASHIGLIILFTVLFAELNEKPYIAFSLISFFGAWKAFEAFDNICIACRFYELLESKNIKVVSL